TSCGRAVVLWGSGDLAGVRGGRRGGRAGRQLPAVWRPVASTGTGQTARTARVSEADAAGGTSPSSLVLDRADLGHRPALRAVERAAHCRTLLPAERAVRPVGRADRQGGRQAPVPWLGWA